RRHATPAPPAPAPAVPARPEHGAEKEPEGDEHEPDQLGVLVPAGLLRLRALLPHARGRARLEHAFRASPRHVPRFDAPLRSPPGANEDMAPPDLPSVRRWTCPHRETSMRFAAGGFVLRPRSIAPWP